MLLFSPIEQFTVISLGPICSGTSNLTSYFILINFIFISIFFILENEIIIRKINYNNHMFITTSNIFINDYYNLFFIPTRIQYLVEIFFLEFIKNFKNLIILPFLNFFIYIFICIINFILVSNLIGLVPYTFTITAQIFITFNIAICIFISFNIIGYLKYNFQLINIIIPTGIHLILHFLLIPIEMISYLFRPISLAIRLFANIMAGHTLLKVICGFIFNFFKVETFLILSIIPFSIITILYGLESFVACIQSYVFFILLSLFLKDILIINH